ncbi:Phosphoinositide phospholipase C, partial [Operophtera brumata]
MACVQAIKFRGLSPLSPRSSVKQASAPKQHAETSAASSSFESSESSDSATTLAGRAPPVLPLLLRQRGHRQEDLQEASHGARRAHRDAALAFWACGVQLVALNYQTEDAAMAVNAAMYRGAHNGCTGYVRKPPVMWDPAHSAYRRFNPMDKEFDGIHASHLTLAVISGQYVAENVYSFYNAFVEVEILGLPPDCRKIRTKVARRNALNPEVPSRAPTQRVLGPHERVLRAATARSGARLLLKRPVLINPPRYRSASSDRARDKDRPAPSEGHEDTKPTDSYLVCVHNVSHEIPYAILK